MNKMYGLIIGLLLIFLMYVKTDSQTYNPDIYSQKFFEINQSNNNNFRNQNGAWEFLGRDFVKLKPGFEFTANPQKSFRARIDKNIIVNGSYETDAQVYNPVSKLINTDFPVGSINGNYSVLPTGAFTYQIPIFTPPGTHGIQPSISIVYNSQSGNGLLGYGWNLSGVSAITRSPKSPYLDNESSGINLNSNDKFALDGQRLICIAGFYGGNSSVYHTEIETFSKVTLYGGNAVNGPDHFISETKDGSIIEYGNTPDSRVKVAGSDIVLMWKINKITDINGNYIIFHYNDASASEGESWLVSIEYTGNDKIPPLLPYNKVEFFYEKRNDQNTMYVAGYGIPATMLLAKIVVLSEQQFVKSYNFKYYLDHYSHLYDIKETGQEDLSLNSTTVKWNQALSNDADMLAVKTVYPTQGSSNLNAAGKNGFIHGDFDGDGKTDYILINEDNNSWTLYYNISNNSTDINFEVPSSGGSGNLDGIRKDAVYFKNGEIIYSNSFAADINKDGKTDLIICCKGYEKQYIVVWDEDLQQNVEILHLVYIGYNYVAVLNNSDLNNRFQFDFENSTNAIQSIPKHIMRYGDFLGLQENQILAMNEDNNKANILVFDQTDKRFELRNQNFDLPSELNEMRDQEDFLTGDFDGDTKCELFVNHNINNNDISSFKIYKLSANSGNIAFSTYYDESIGNNSIRERPCVLTGDFNGDGKTDLLYYEVLATNYVSIPNIYWRLKLATGSGFVQNDPMVENFTANGCINMGYFGLLQGFAIHGDGGKVACWRNAIFQTGDFNGDGKTDVIELISNQNTNGTDSKVYYSYGNGFNSETFFRDYINFPLENFGGVNSLSCYDFNGDGNADLLWDGIPMNCDEGLITVKYRSLYGFFVHNSENNHNISSIIDGNNNELKVGFQLMNHYFNYSKSNISLSYPLLKTNAPIYLTSTVEMDDNTTNSNNMQIYSYKDAVVHTLGKGFLGFLENKVNSKIYQGVNCFAEKWETNTNTIDNTYYYLSLVKTKSENVNDGTTSQTEFTNSIIDFGNKRLFPFIESTKTIDYLNLTTTESIFEYENETTPNDFFGNLYKKTNKVYDYIPSGTDMLYSVSSDEFTYIQTAGVWCPCSIDIQTHKQKFVLNSDPEYVRISDFGYNSEGLLESKIIDPSDTKSVKEEYLYDDFGNIIEKTVSAPNATSNPPKPNDRTTKYEYDLKGRFNIKTTDPLDFVSQAVYDPAFGNILKNIGHTKLETNYKYDGFGNLTQTDFPDGKISTISHVYVQSSDPNKTIGTYSSFTKTIQNETNKPQLTTYYDSHGRTLRTETIGFNNTKIFVDYLYDSKGRNDITYEPYSSSGGRKGWTETEFDFYDRVISTSFKPANSLPGVTTTMAYDDINHSISTTDAKSRTTKIEYDIIGNKIKSIDNNGNYIEYEYFNSGKLKSAKVKDSPGNTLSTQNITYDLQGNQTSLDDDNAGTFQYIYDAFGQLYYQRNSKNEEFKFHYDKAGHITKKIWPNGNAKTTYTYFDNSSPNAGLLKQVIAPNGSSSNYEYDIYGRETKTTEITFDGSISHSFTTLYEYLNYGRDKKVTFPSGFKVLYTYNGNTNLLDHISINDNPLNKIYKIIDVDAFGRVRAGYLSNWELHFSEEFNEYGFLINKKVENGNFQNETYTYDKDDGNLLTRQSGTNLIESFEYDDLDRLESMVITGRPAKNIVYSGNGNIDNKADLGTYSYDANKKHAVTEIIADNAYSSISNNIQNIAYTAFDKVATISENNKTANFVYGPDNNRRLMTINNQLGTPIIKRFYVGNYEKEILPNGIVRELHYISSPNGLCAVYIKETSKPDKLYYVQTDRQGSIVGLILKENGIHTQVAKYDYDAWGRMRDPNTLEYINNYLNPQLTYIPRGYTGHEHLESFAIINMNGRIYDPAIGRFFSPDNYIQQPDNPQSYNRYSYCINNPLKYTDPSGEIFAPIIIAATISALVSASTQAVLTGTVNWTNVGVSAISAGLTAGFGGVPGILPGAAYGAASNVLANGIANVIMGNKFGDNWESSAISGAISGGINGGLNAAEAGKNLWWGTDITYGNGPWSFFNIEQPYKVLKLDYENVYAEQLMYCVPATIQAQAKYWKLTNIKSQDALFELDPLRTSDGMSKSGISAAIGAQGLNKTDIDFLNFNDVEYFLKDKQPVTVYLPTVYQVGKEVNHMMTIIGIEYYSYGYEFLIADPMGRISTISDITKLKNMMTLIKK